MEQPLQTGAAQREAGVPVRRRTHAACVEQPRSHDAAARRDEPRDHRARRRAGPPGPASFLNSGSGFHSAARLPPRQGLPPHAGALKEIYRQKYKSLQTTQSTTKHSLHQLQVGTDKSRRLCEMPRAYLSRAFLQSVHLKPLLRAEPAGTGGRGTQPNPERALAAATGDSAVAFRVTGSASPALPPPAVSPVTLGCSPAHLRSLSGVSCRRSTLSGAASDGTEQRGPGGR
ncbi:hypothetical protein MATL_G00200660 [Megalops atlanticus]|uniref:Uncharacterized protein n=1 Tax=Megalops atlanticus TaxID=7932 RepID=A0A9D3SZZ5_MEGAT|nr:hypothetical protein MATL_G00200660 [Megalops atlanticus]